MADIAELRAHLQARETQRQQHRAEWIAAENRGDFAAAEAALSKIHALDSANAQYIPILLEHIDALAARAFQPVQQTRGRGVDVNYGDLILIEQEDGNRLPALCHGARWGGSQQPDAWVVKYAPLGGIYVGNTVPYQRCYRLPGTVHHSAEDRRRERDQDHG